MHTVSALFPDLKNVRMKFRVVLASACLLAVAGCDSFEDVVDSVSEGIHEISEAAQELWHDITNYDIGGTNVNVSPRMGGGVITITSPGGTTIQTKVGDNGESGSVIVNIPFGGGSSNGPYISQDELDRALREP